MDNLKQFNEVFFEEAQEHLETMETLLLAYDIDAPDLEDLNSIFRAAHSIKGGSGIFGFNAMTGLTHVMENMLDAARNQTLKINGDLITVLLDTIDVLKDVLESYRGEYEVDWETVKTAESAIEHAHVKILEQQQEETTVETSGSPATTETSDQPNSKGLNDLDFGFFDDEPVSIDSEDADDLNLNLFDEEPDLSDAEDIDDLGFGFFDEEVDLLDAEDADDLNLNLFDEEPNLSDAEDTDDLGFGFFDEELELSDSEEADDLGFGFFYDEPDLPVLEESEDVSFGFFEDVANLIGAPNSTDDYGFFEELNVGDDEGFGFFDDAPVISALDNTEELDYGFFEDIEALVKRPPSEDSYGFFSDIRSVESLGRDQNQSVSAITPISIANTQGSTSGNRSAQPVLRPQQTEMPAVAKSLQKKKATSKGAGAEQKTEANSIRVETVKIDKLVNLVGELVITQSMLNLIGAEVQDSVLDKMQAALAELERNTRDIQEAVMSVRMLPISFVFNRFPRLVRDLSVKLEKKINLVVEGGHTEIDKNLVEKISDPLTHLIRNSIDHGIELPATRLERGKSETGTVTLSAEQKGNEVVITITDDGMGLSRERILSKAVEKDIPLPLALTDDAVWQLIFAPGFSTAAEVTDVSGRGVGMDVVKRNIESLGGRVEISSQEGHGATFRISLPLTLAILDGMCVEAGEQVYIIPLINIVESIQPTKEQIKVIKNNPILWVRGEYWPLVEVGKALSGSSEKVCLESSIVVLVETNQSRFGLVVDNLVGQQQVVIKSLERHFRRVEGIAGATIMGDGSVALIIDADTITQFINIETKGDLAHVYH